MPFPKRRRRDCSCAGAGWTSATRSRALRFGTRLHPRAAERCMPPLPRRRCAGAPSAGISQRQRRAGRDRRHAALEDAASAAGVRGGVSARGEGAGACRAIDARLSEPRARRLLRAGFAAEAAGRLEHAEELLAEAADLTESPALRGEAVARWPVPPLRPRRSRPRYRAGDGEAERAPPVVAARVLTASGVVHALVHRLDIPTALTMAERAAELAGQGAHDDLDICHMLAWTRRISGRTSDALALALECVERIDPGTILAVDFALHFVFLEDYGPGESCSTGPSRERREAGALGNLAYALDMLVAARYPHREAHLGIRGVARVRPARRAAGGHHAWRRHSGTSHASRRRWVAPRTRAPTQRDRSRSPKDAETHTTPFEPAGHSDSTPSRGVTSRQPLTGLSQAVDDARRGRRAPPESVPCPRRPDRGAGAGGPTGGCRRNLSVCARMRS